MRNQVVPVVMYDFCINYTAVGVGADDIVSQLNAIMNNISKCSDLNVVLFFWP